MKVIENAYIMECWDTEKNSQIGLNPNKLTNGSNKFAFFKCKKGHSFRARIYCMSNSIKGLNCPYCRGQKVMPGFNDLETTHPELAKQWDYQKNIKTPKEVKYGDNNKYWWICPKGHNWASSLVSRATGGHGCPYCTHQKPEVGKNDITTTNPELLDIWDYDRNKSVVPKDVMSKSSRNIWWNCGNGHSYQAPVYKMSNGKRCPFCNGMRVWTGFNDIATTNSDILKEWDYGKNTIKPEKVSQGTHKKAWWICSKGHSWQTSIHSRIMGRGCPECAKETMSSLPEKFFYYYLKKYMPDAIENAHFSWLGKREYDIYIPSLRLAIEYDGERWHRDFDNDLTKDELSTNHKITLIRIREKQCPNYAGSGIVIDCDAPHSNLKKLVPSLNVLFTIINNVYKKDFKLDVDVERDNKEINELLITYNKEKSLAFLSPEIAKEWNYDKNGKVTPEMVYNRTQRRYWWKCEKGHEWLAGVDTRTRSKGSGCPYCSNHSVLTGYNDLETMLPELTREWNYKKNTNIPSKVNCCSNTKYWWKCEKGHEWEASPNTRKKGIGCPYCSNHFAWKGFNDLETLYPDIAKEFDLKENYSVKPSDVVSGSHKKYWWICSKGHSYNTGVFMRTLNKTGCPYCAGNRILKGYNDLSTLYPNIAQLWNYEKNVDKDICCFGVQSKYKLWWKCSKGHEWQTHIQTIIGNKGKCPVCNQKR